MLDLKTYDTPDLVCVECNHSMNMSDGDDGEAPRPGDFALCIRCASLNIFNEHGRFRQPTLDEYLEAAKSSKPQRIRRAILSVPKAIRHA